VIDSVNSSFDLFLCDIKELIDLLINSKPGSKYTLINRVGLLRAYAKWCIDNKKESNKDVLTMLDSLDIDDIWDKLKYVVDQKYINHAQYLDITAELEWEDYNALYYKTLFMAIYEGIYDKDLYSIRHLRARDIRNDCHVLIKKRSGNLYLKITEELRNNLIELSKIDIWESFSYRGENPAKTIMRGEYPDSVFKVTTKSLSSITTKSFKEFCYNKFKKIYKNYLGFKLKPHSLYLSGLMHKIQIRCKEDSYNINDIFSLHKKDAFFTNYVTKILTENGYEYSVYRFRMNIIDFMYVFSE